MALVAGFAWLIRLNGQGLLSRDWVWTGLFLGLGGFQLFDGLVNHEVLRLHQFRYGVPLLPYDSSGTWPGPG